MQSNPMDIPRVVDAVGLLCTQRGADNAIYERMLKYGGEVLQKGGSVDEAISIVKRALDSAGYPELADVIPPLEG